MNQPVEGSVPSPCINVCKMNERSGLCEGCLRTLDEIAADLQTHPERYSAWFRIYMARHRDKAEAFAIPS